MALSFAENVIEVSLLGGGNAYGESIVIHLGNNNWVIVDSAKNPNTGESLPLEYLKSINVDYENNVKLIVSTHWHDDHIHQLTKLLKACKNAKFCCSSVIQEKSFLVLVQEAANLDINKAGLTEMLTALQYQSKEKRSIVTCSSDKCLLNINLSNNSIASIYALSPSKDAVDLFVEKSNKLIVKVQTYKNKKLPTLHPNRISVVLAVKVGENEILLGADLETTKDVSTGWTAVINTTNKTSNATIYKVPHHGSKTAHLPEIWESLLQKETYALITPYGRGRRFLPDQNSVNKILQQTNLAYITSHPRPNDKPKKRSNSVNKMIHNLGIKLQEIPYNFGQIRLRKPLDTVNDKWDIELIGESLLLQELYEPS